LDVEVFVDVDMMGVCLCVFFCIWITSSDPGRQRQKPFLTRVFIGN